MQRKNPRQGFAVFCFVFVMFLFVLFCVSAVSGQRSAAVSSMWGDWCVGRLVCGGLVWGGRLIVHPTSHLAVARVETGVKLGDLAALAGVEVLVVHLVHIRRIALCHHRGCLCARRV
jgi:hypothetical protein